jgi:DNA-binding PucR family transcriptional regulator
MHVDLAVRAAVGVAPSLGRTAEARREADRVLDAMERGLSQSVATIDDVRAEVIVSELLALVGERPELRDPRLDELIAYDAKHSANLVESVMAYLDALGDVRSAAARLHVHPNTLRYRVRRAEQVAGIDLGDPRQRLVAQLQLSGASGAG